MSYQTILYEVKEHIAYVTLNRPDVMNAFNHQMKTDLIAACDEIERDPEVRVVIITGAGERAFSAGADLKEMASASWATPPVAERGRWGLPIGTDRVLAVMKPIIAAINGYAVGGGCELALACDIRVAADNARLGLMEVRRGIIPGGGGTQMLPRAVGRGLALEIALTGELIDAREAHRIGLVNHVVPPLELMPTVERIAGIIARNAPLAVRFVKEAIQKGLNLTLEQGLRLEVDLSTLLSTTEDAKEGPRAFAEKREPQWKGR